jgi:hypothetical protein
MTSFFGTSQNGSTGRGSEGFPDPFCDVASIYMPETMQDALRWCEYIFLANGVYRQACDRVISYFITDLDIRGDDSEEKDKFSTFLNDTLGIHTLLHTIGMDYLCYGNSFTSLIVPIKRYLFCPKCKLELPLRKVYNEPVFKFQWKSFKFHAKCPKCKYSGEWPHNDRRSTQEADLVVKRWNPHEMDLLWDPLTDEVSYIWRIPSEYQKLIKEGNLFQLERANWEIIEAVKNDQVLRFDKDVIYHMKEDALSGVRNRGWGISRVLSNFRQAWYVQVLHRYNEAIALDYVIPFRMITPEPRNGAGGEFVDPALNFNLGSFTSRVESMLGQRRRDPARWNILPFPVQYQALGGDATQLAPTDLMDQGLDTLLNAIGVPMEMYKGTLTLQSAPAALRLFESSWSHLVHNLNRFVDTMVKKVAKLMSWEPVSAKLTRVTHADDLNRQMAKLQLMMGGSISQSTGLKSVGMDFEEEQRRKLEEEMFIAEETHDMQEKMDQVAQMDGMAMPAQAGQAMGPPGAAPPAGAMPPGGAPPPAGGGVMGTPTPAGSAAEQFSISQPTQPNQPTTPEEMLSQAQTLAQQLMSLPDTQRKSELIKLKRVDPTMHSLVTSALDEIRQQARTMGQQQVLAQQYGQQPPSGGM